MGYTHYWSLKAKPSAEAWGRYMAAIDTLLQTTRVPLAWEWDEPGRLPEVCTGWVRFNGVGRDGHETFLVRPKLERFSFCKTAGKPYDSVVVACLILGAHLLPCFTWSSDGDRPDHEEGLALAKQVCPDVRVTGCDYGSDEG